MGTSGSLISLVYLQYERLLIDCEGVQKAEFVFLSEMFHLEASHVQHLGVAPHHPVQQPLGGAAQQWRSQALGEGQGGHIRVYMRTAIVRA